MVLLSAEMAVKNPGLVIFIAEQPFTNDKAPADKATASATFKAWEYSDLTRTDAPSFWDYQGRMQSKGQQEYFRT